MNTKPPRNRKGKQIYAGVAALATGFAFVVWISSMSDKAEVISAYTALYVSYCTAICALCGVGIWGNVKEHESVKENGNQNEIKNPTGGGGAADVPAGPAGQP